MAQYAPDVIRFCEKLAVAPMSHNGVIYLMLTLLSLKAYTQVYAFGQIQVLGRIFDKA